MIAIVDYGAGNLFSVKNALDFIGESSIFTSNPNEILSADKVILPGVGAFPDAMKMLDNANLTAVLKHSATEKPLLGICLGMQMLFENSDEFNLTNGLSLINGSISKIKTNLKIPHMGYNQLEFNRENPLLFGLKENCCVYFVHSFMAYTDTKNVIAYCDYGINSIDNSNVKIPALVSKGNVYGAQFHPEKSGETGLTILRNFANL